MRPRVSRMFPGLGMGVCALFQTVSALESADLSLDSQCRCLRGWMEVAAEVAGAVVAVTAAVVVVTVTVVVVLEVAVVVPVVVVVIVVVVLVAAVVWVVEVVVIGTVPVAPDLKLQLIDQMPTSVSGVGLWS